MDSVNGSGHTHNMPYVRAFLTENPEVGLDILSNRFKDAQKLDTELADYFKERASIEDQYAKHLVKASKKLFVSDPSILGHLSPLWAKLLDELTEMSNIHAALSHSIANEVEIELRNLSQRYSAPIQTLQHGMSEFATSGKKHKKNKKGLERGGSILFKRGSDKSALHSQNDLNWQVKGPEILSDLQLADKRRLEHIRNTVQKFEEIQTEHLRQQSSMADETLSVCLSYVPEHEVNEFAKTHGRNLKVQQPLTHSPSVKSTPPPPVEVSTPPIIPRPTLSNGGPRRSSNRDSKLFSALTSIRRKPKAEKLDNYHSESNQMEIISDNTNKTQHSTESSEPVPINVSTSSASDRPTPLDSHPSVPVDEQGYSVPPTNKSLIPDHASGENVSDAFFDDENQRATGLKYHVDIKQNTVHEENEEDTHTLQRMASILKEKNASVPRRPRGRRDPARNSTLNERWPTDASLSIANPHSVTRDASVSTLDSNSYNPFQNSSFESHHSPRTMTPSSSVSASPTMGSMELPTVISPLPTVEESMTPSLSASIAETVNLKLTGGEVEQAHITGEISLQYSGPASSAGLLVFRIEKNNTIDSLLPNKHIIRTIDESKGIYGIGKAESSSLRGRNVVCFKYKLKSSNIGSGDMLPVNFIPAWRLEDSCIKLMVKYQANSQMSTKQTAIWVKPGNKSVSSVQSTPQGTWNPERHVLSWEADALKLDGSSHQLLARFAIATGTATSQPMIALTFSCDGVTASHIALGSIEESLDDNQQAIQVQVIHQTLRSGRVIATS